MSFLNRIDAGRQLARVMQHTFGDALVVGITRGGVPVGAELARELGAPFDICVVRSLATDAGRGFGFVAEAGGLFIDWARVEQFDISFEEISEATRRVAIHVARLAALYRDGPGASVADRDIVLVDDGLITRGAAEAAVHSLRRRQVRGVELAVPIADAAVLGDVRPLFDHVLALEAESPLGSIGTRYSDLSAVSEAEIVDLLAASQLGRHTAGVVVPR